MNQRRVLDVVLVSLCGPDSVPEEDEDDITNLFCKENKLKKKRVKAKLEEARKKGKCLMRVMIQTILVYFPLSCKKRAF